MKPVPAGATGRFQERAVAADLQGSFAAIWIHQLPTEKAPPVIVAPDGTIDLQWIDGVLRVAGPDKDPKTEILPAGATVIGFRFRPAAAAHGGILARCAMEARALLATPRDEVPLHGDIHHGNVLDFGPERGWLAIDPKRLYGERAFDYANLFCNPDRETATAPGRLARRANLVAEESGLDRTRLLRWVLVWAGLSATWMMEDGGATPEVVLSVAEMAAAELG